MWKIFGAKCVKFVAFCILQSFTSTNVDALITQITTNLLIKPEHNTKPTHTSKFISL